MRHVQDWVRRANPWPESNSVKLPVFGYLHGEVKGIVSKLINHRDFDNNPDRSKIVKNRAARNTVFGSIAVDLSLENARIKHSCKLAECNENCTFGKPTALLHIQKAIFALEVALSQKAFTAM